MGRVWVGPGKARRCPSSKSILESHRADIWASQFLSAEPTSQDWFTLYGQPSLRRKSELWFQQMHKYKQKSVALPRLSNGVHTHTHTPRKSIQVTLDIGTSKGGSKGAKARQFCSTETIGGGRNSIHLSPPINSKKENESNILIRGN